MSTVVRYKIPSNWLQFNAQAIVGDLANAKAAVIALTRIPYQRSWAEKLQRIQLKREIAGTSRIEGADFTEGELDAALSETPEESFTRSQKQAHAAKRTYQWISSLPDDQPVNTELVLQVHRLIISGADDDHCEPGKLRGAGHNVTFGIPRHRGAEGGAECEHAFTKLMEAVGTGFKAQDTLIQALALHYHFAAIHPFGDGNGRTARALEALMLQKAGLRDVLFIAMSNFYYEEKAEYLESLNQARARGHDLTPFLQFGLRGIASQCEKLFREIGSQVSKALFRDVMYQFYNRLQSTRKRVIIKRQIGIVEVLFTTDSIRYRDLRERTANAYRGLKKDSDAFVRDLSGLLHLDAIRMSTREDGEFVFSLNPDWPTQITETTFFQKVKALPKAKTDVFPR